MSGRLTSVIRRLTANRVDVADDAGDLAMGHNSTFRPDVFNDSTHQNGGVGTNSHEISTVDASNDLSMCYICDRSFQTQQMLKMHMTQMHTPKALVCPFCHSRHGTLDALRSHCASEHKAASQWFIGDSAEYSPTTGDSDQSVCPARIHLPRTKNGRHAEFPFGSSAQRRHKTTCCRYCQKLFVTQRALLQHVYLKHYQERNGQCSRCGEKFETAGLLSLHRRYAHADNTTGKRCLNYFDGNKVESNVGSSLHGGSKATAASASFPMPSTIWTGSGNQDAASASKDGFLISSNSDRPIADQSIGNEMDQWAADGLKAKKKMHVKCSMCNATFSNGYACYLHRKKIHGDDSLRRKRPINFHKFPFPTPPATSPSISVDPPEMAPAATVNANLESVTSGMAVQSGLSSASSSSSRGSSPFCRANDTSATEGAVVRRRYEFHCQCGETFYNGFAYSRHRQRTGCIDGVRGVMVKESICGVCSEAFPSAQSLNEHFSSMHGNGASASMSTSVSASAPACASTSASVSASASTSTFRPIAMKSVTKLKQEQNPGTVGISNRISSEIGSNWDTVSVVRNESTSTNENGRIGHGPTATAYVTTTPLKGLPISQSVSASSSAPSTSASLPLRCLYCPYETVSMEILIEHGHRHQMGGKRQSGRLGELCPYCTYVTDNMANYVRHSALHIVEKSRLGLEKNTEKSGEENSGRSACVYCGRWFERMADRMEHELEHIGGKGK